MEDFESEASKLAWENFEATGNIGFYSLYHAIETSEKTDYEVEGEERER